jgi:hypothetical protein
MDKIPGSRSPSVFWKEISFYSTPEGAPAATDILGDSNHCRGKG